MLALLVGVNFLTDKEVFDKTHLVKAIQNYLPHIQAVENSSFSSRKESIPIGTLYLEIEKTMGDAFDEF